MPGLPRLLAAIVLALVLAPAAHAAGGERTCRERVEGARPIPFPEEGRAGPLAFGDLTRLADPATFEHYKVRSGRYSVKNGVSVLANRVVTLSIDPAHRALAKLEYSRRGTRVESLPSVRFRSCRRDQPAFSYDGVVGESTAYSGGFALTRPACVTVRVRARGGRRSYRRTISFGMGDSCASAASS